MRTSSAIRSGKIKILVKVKVGKKINIRDSKRKSHKKITEEIIQKQINDQRLCSQAIINT